MSAMYDLLVGVVHSGDVSTGSTRCGLTLGSFMAGQEGQTKWVLAWEDRTVEDAELCEVCYFELLLQRSNTASDALDAEVETRLGEVAAWISQQPIKEAM